MVGKIKRWIKDKLGISALERENVRLDKEIGDSTAAYVTEFGKVWDKCYATAKADADSTEDHEARIVFLESLPKPAKIAAKPHKTTFRQFAAAASEATEEKE